MIPMALVGLCVLLQANPIPDYAQTIAPIIHARCANCHHAGAVAPFPLTEYDHVRKRADLIWSVIESGQMPPWSPSTTEGGPFQGVLALTQQERDLIRDWIKVDCPPGDLSRAPEYRGSTSSWSLGDPDLVIQVPEAYTVAAEGDDEFRVFVVPSGLKTGRWVRAVDVKPGNRSVVHHVLVAYDTTDRARVLDANHPGPGYPTAFGFNAVNSPSFFFPSGGLSGWAPGKRPTVLPPGIGRYLPANADVLIQVHYHKTGKVEQDATSVGIYFSETPAEKQIVPGGVFPPRKSKGGFPRPTLQLPAGSNNVEVLGQLMIPDDYHLRGLTPHMHLLGKDIRLNAEFPDGQKRTLIAIDQWQYNWQTLYEFKDPIPLPKGTMLRLIAHFDNSAENPNNPNHPPKDVHWGEQTTDEMCIVFMELTRDKEQIEASSEPPPRPMPVIDLPPWVLQLRDLRRGGAPGKKE